MNIAIFNHPFSDLYTSPKRLYKSILYYLKEIIINNSQKNHNVECYDVVKKLKKETTLPEQLLYLKEYLVDDNTDYSFFKKYYQFGSPDNFNHKHFKMFNSDLIIITSFAYCYFDGFKSMVNYLKRLADVPIICGGHGPSSDPEYYLKNSNVDYVVVGPAELTLNILLQKISEGKVFNLENVFYHGYSGKIDLNKEYQYKPYIDIKDKKNVSLQLTRGCPKRCSYCSVPIISGNVFKKVDLDIFNELIKNLELTEKVHFNFEDDNLSHNEKYLFEVLDIVKKHFPDSTISFENGIDFTTLNFEMIDRLVNYGITQWNLSLTSISSKTLSDLGRNYLRDDFDEIIDYIEKFELPIIVYYICGMPKDTEENTMETLFYLSTKRILIGISTFYPVPKTSITKKINKEIVPIFSKGSSFYQWGNITTKKLITFFMLTRFINVIKKHDNIELKAGDDVTKKSLLHSIEKKKLYYVDSKDDLLLYDLDDELVMKFFNTWKLK